MVASGSCGFVLVLGDACRRILRSVIVGANFSAVLGLIPARSERLRLVGRFALCYVASPASALPWHCFDGCCCADCLGVGAATGSMVGPAGPLATQNRESGQARKGAAAAVAACAGVWLTGLAAQFELDRCAPCRLLLGPASAQHRPSGDCASTQVLRSVAVLGPGRAGAERSGLGYAPINDGAFSAPRFSHRFDAGFGPLFRPPKALKLPR